MTRLLAEWIEDISHTIKDKERKLKGLTGLDYTMLAAKASGFSESDISRAARSIKVGVVPVSSGQGIIEPFSGSVASVTATMGFQSFVTEKSDVSGIFEAYSKEADIIYMSDDSKYVAKHLHKRKIVENNYATAAGYIAAIEGANGSLAAKEVLLLGFGTLGREFLKVLKKRGSVVTGYDMNASKRKQMEREGVTLLTGVKEMKRFNYIIDATNLGGWIHEDMLHKEAFIAAPGIPLSLDSLAKEKYQDRLLHDYLEIGTAAMLGLVL